MGSPLQQHTMLAALQSGFLHYALLSSPSEGLDRHADMPSRPPQWSTLSTLNQTFHQVFSLTLEHKSFFCLFYFDLHLTPTLVLVSSSCIIVVFHLRKKIQSFYMMHNKHNDREMRKGFTLFTAEQIAAMGRYGSEQVQIIEQSNKNRPIPINDSELSSICCTVFYTVRVGLQVV